MSVAVDATRVAEVDTEPGTLPETMAAWVIRQEREGEPRDAFQIEEIEVPEPGAFEVIVRVMAAGVNYNNVWAAMGKPVSVFGYGDHPEYGHHIGGSDASGVVWKVGPGVTRWKPGDEVVIHCNQASYEDPEVHGLDPLAAPSQRIWGYETTWGSFAQFTKVQAQQLLPKPAALSWEEAASYGLTYFTAYRMLITRCNMQAGDKVLIWGAAGGLGVFATQLAAMAGAESVGVVSSAEKGELVMQLGATGYIDRNEYKGMMRVGGEDKDAEKARFKESRRFSKAVAEILGDAARHRVRARRAGDVPDLRADGQAVRQGRHLRRHDGLQPGLRRALPVDAPEGDPRLALRQRVRVPEGQRAHRPGQDPAGAVADDAVRRRRRGSPAHEGEPAPRQDLDPRRRRRGGPGEDRRGRGRDPRGGRRVMAGGVCLIPWYATLFRADRFEEALMEIAPIASRYNAIEWEVLRSRDDGYRYRHFSTWPDKLAFDRYWYGPEFQRWRADYQGWFQIPIVYEWHERIARQEVRELEDAFEAEQAGETAAAE